MNRIFKSMVGALAFFATTQLCVMDRALANVEFETLSLLYAPLTLDTGESRVLSIGSWRHVRKLYIQATGVARDAVFEVIVNGDVKGTVHVPGADPSYVVTVAETAGSILLRHVSGAQVRVVEILAVVSRDEVPPYDTGEGNISLPVANQAAALAHEAIVLVKALQPHSSMDDFEAYLLPIKLSAGRAYAMAVHGDLSDRTRLALVGLLAQIDFARPYIDQCLKQDETFDFAVRVLMLREKLTDLLH